MFDSPVGQSQDKHTLTSTPLWSDLKNTKPLWWCCCCSACAAAERGRSSSYTQLRSVLFKHKAHLIGWVCLCLTEPVPNSRDSEICWPSFYLLSSLPKRLLALLFSLSQNTCAAVPPTTTPPLIPSLSDDTGPQGFLPDLIWDLTVAKECLSTPHTLLRTRALMCFSKYSSAPRSYCSWEHDYHVQQEAICRAGFILIYNSV